MKKKTGLPCPVAVVAVLALMVLGVGTGPGRAAAWDAEVLPGVGAGHLFLGMTMAQAEAAMDAFYGGHYYDSDGMLCSVQQDPTGSGAYCVDDGLTDHSGKVEYIYVTDPAAYMVMDGRPVRTGEALDDTEGAYLVDKLGCANGEMAVPGTEPALGIVWWDTMGVTIIALLGDDSAQVFGYVVEKSADDAVAENGCADEGGN